MKRKKIMACLIITIMLSITFFTNLKTYASTSCNADEAITKVQSLVGSTVRLSG